MHKTCIPPEFVYYKPRVELKGKKEQGKFPAGLVQPASGADGIAVRRTASR